MPTYIQNLYVYMICTHVHIHTYTPSADRYLTSRSFCVCCHRSHVWARVTFATRWLINFADWGRDTRTNGTSYWNIYSISETTNNYFCWSANRRATISFASREISVEFYSRVSLSLSRWKMVSSPHVRRQRFSRICDAFKVGRWRKDRYYALCIEMYTTLLPLEEQIHCERILHRTWGTCVVRDGRIANALHRGQLGKHELAKFSSPVS